MKNTILGNNVQFAKYPFPDFADAQVRNRISSVELTLMTPHVYVDSFECIDPMKVCETLSERGIRITSVTPPPYRYSICSEEGTCQNERTIGYYMQCILFAEKAEAEYLTITASGADYDKESGWLVDNAEKTLKKLSEFAFEHKVTLLLGTVPGEESPYNASTPVLLTVDEVKEMIQRISSPALKAYLDVQVMSLVGETIPEWFEKLGDDIRLVRFTDGNYNGYRIWGRGCLPCEKYLRDLSLLGYEGPLSLQVPGERYASCPEEAEKEMLEYLREKMEKVVV